jgi:hypothetical protein
MNDEISDCRSANNSVARHREVAINVRIRWRVSYQIGIFYSRLSINRSTLDVTIPDAGGTGILSYRRSR